MTGLLVFGKTGQVAQELQIQGNVVALDRSMADLSDPQACARAITEHAPRAVINAAAYTAVDKAETDYDLAKRINGDAPGAMADACAALDIPFLHLSTDYVFDGTGTEPWSPQAPTSPINAYGRSKLIGEEAIRASGARQVILRTAWVFSAHGNNFVKTMLRLAQTHPTLRVIDDQRGGPTSARALAAALLRIAEALQGQSPGGTYHLAGAPPTTWAGFARDIFDQAGLPTQVTPIPTSEYPTPAARPANSVLECQSLAQDFGIAQPDWRKDLHATLTDLGALL